MTHNLSNQFGVKYKQYETSLSNDGCIIWRNSHIISSIVTMYLRAFVCVCDGCKQWGMCSQFFEHLVSSLIDIDYYHMLIIKLESYSPLWSKMIFPMNMESVIYNIRTWMTYYKPASYKLCLTLWLKWELSHHILQWLMPRVTIDG